MGLWRFLLPYLPNPCLEIRYEDLVEDLEGSARRVLEFLGVRWDPAVLRFHERAAGRLIRSPSYAEVTRPVFRRAVGRWRGYAKFLDPVAGPLQPFLEAYGCP
jgi:hypothetical protein